VKLVWAQPKEDTAGAKQGTFKGRLARIGWSDWDLGHEHRTMEFFFFLATVRPSESALAKAATASTRRAEMAFILEETVGCSVRSLKALGI
jgi:hypothetical protein